MGITRAKKWRTSTPDPAAPPALASQTATSPLQIPTGFWVADITCTRTDQESLYLAVVIDVFSRMIVGWSMRNDIKADLVIDALSMAVGRRRPGRGARNAAPAAAADTPRSPSGRSSRRPASLHRWGRRVDAYDSATAGSFMAIIKTELTTGTRFATKRAARSAILDDIEGFYNRCRRHSALGYKSPLVFEQIHATLLSAEASVA